jgi:hypothetical protein
MKPRYLKNKSRGNYEHGLQFTLYLYFLSHFFHPLRVFYIVKKVSAEQNAGHVQL